jgi:hypothetical protein
MEGKGSNGASPGNQPERGSRVAEQTEKDEEESASPPSTDENLFFERQRRETHWRNESSEARDVCVFFDFERRWRDGCCAMFSKESSQGNRRDRTRVAEQGVVWGREGKEKNERSCSSGSFVIYSFLSAGRAGGHEG